LSADGPMHYADQIRNKSGILQEKIMAPITLFVAINCEYDTSIQSTIYSKNTHTQPTMLQQSNHKNK